MTDIYRKQIDHPSAWTGKSLGGKEALARRLNAAQLDAIDDLLAKSRHLKLQEVTRQDFTHPALDPFLAEIYEVLQHGRGIVLIQGVTPDRYSEEDFQRIYWGFGTHWGEAVVQNKWGDRLGHVRQEKDNPNGRGYIGNQELSAHSDPYPLIGLMCIGRAETGGESHLVSGLALHNEMLKTRPDLLEPLYRGHVYTAPDAQRMAKPVTDYEIPVFSVTEGVLSSLYLRSSMDRATVALGTSLPADLQEALDHLDALAAREDIRIAFTLEPGDMLLVNNYTALHAREPFENSERNTRHLLRLWLKVPEGRPVHPALARYSATYEQMYRDQMAAERAKAH